MIKNSTIKNSIWLYKTKTKWKVWLELICKNIIDLLGCGVCNLNLGQGLNYIPVFSSANDQTASHEFLHAFNLAHSFTNSEADSNAEYTYNTSKPIIY